MTIQEDMDMNATTFEIVKIVITAVATIIGIIITKEIVPYIKSIKLTAEQEAVLEIVETAVKAAEQTIKESGQGAAKKKQVIAYISYQLMLKGIHITEEEIDKLIEAAVYAMKQEQLLLKE